MTRATETIEGWSTVPGGDEYTAPELAGICVQGVCGKDRAGDARWIRTSLVVSAEGRTITTRSGSTYLLGEADPKFVETLRENGLPFDPENPIRKVTKLAPPLRRKGDPKKN